jgi:cyclic pyranopterin monophosphate synthase
LSAQKGKRSSVTLTHVDKEGAARIVDVGDKPETLRSAVAEAFLVVSPGTLAALRAGKGRKGDPKEVARLAALQAAKQTSTLIPLCHPLRLHSVDVEITEAADRLRIVVTVSAIERTGVEMEALTAAAVGALTLYDMVKGVDRQATVTDVRVLEKHGGRSGDWVRAPAL